MSAARTWWADLGERWRYGWRWVWLVLTIASAVEVVVDLVSRDWTGALDAFVLLALWRTWAQLEVARARLTRVTTALASALDARAPRRAP